jgi:hypothetical protein
MSLLRSVVLFFLVLFFVPGLTESSWATIHAQDRTAYVVGQFYDRDPAILR